MTILENLQKQYGGLVCNRNSGSKVIIVIDDCYKQVTMPKGRTPHGFGLREIWEHVRIWEDTRAIGFFPLPGPQKGVQPLLQIIQNWISEVCADNCFCYVLVDVYYGERADVNKAIGLKLEESWSELKIQKSKIAFISIAGREENFPNPRKRDIFIKSDITNTVRDKNQLPPTILYWFDKGHKLQKLWNTTDEWFSCNENLMQHNADVICDYFFSSQLNIQKKSIEYIEKLQNALGITLPNTWWQSKDSIANIHESLKYLCGVHSCCGHEDGTKPISVGAAYLVSLIAHQEVWQNVDPFFRKVNSWENLTKTVNPIFPRQNQTFAQESAIALYDLFIRLFEPKDTEQSQVNTVQFDRNGNVLQIQFGWKSNNLPVKIADRISRDNAEQDVIRVAIPSAPNNTTDAVIRLWKSTLISQHGFMSPGVIYMKEDILTIAFAG
jgi:hypothetical protein